MKNINAFFNDVDKSNNFLRNSIVLHINWNEIIKDESNITLKEISNIVFDRCSFTLFNEPYFFGFDDTIDRNTIFRYMDEQNNTKWKDILFEDALLFLYSSIREIIASNNNLTSSGAYRFSFSGFDYLLQNKKIEFEEKSLQFKISNSLNSDIKKDDIRKKCSAYGNSLRNLYENIDSEYINPKKSGALEKHQKANDIVGSLGKMEIMNILLNNTKLKNSFYNCNDTGRKYDYSHYKTFIDEANKSLKLLADSKNLSKSDLLFTEYLWEELFGLSFASMIVKNVYDDKCFYASLSEDDIKTIARFGSELPFPCRMQIMKDAFFYLNKYQKLKEINDNTCFDLLYSKLRGSYLTELTRNKTSKTSIWVARFEIMAKYLNKVVFPIYRTIFSVGLVSYFVSNYKKETNEKTIDNAGKIEILKKMYLYLSEYINAELETDSIIESNIIDKVLDGPLIQKEIETFRTVFLNFRRKYPNREYFYLDNFIDVNYLCKCLGDTGRKKISQEFLLQMAESNQ